MKIIEKAQQQRAKTIATKDIFPLYLGKLCAISTVG